MDLRPGRTVLDLGAGTGKLTRLLLPSGATVIAVEPLDAMRDRLEAAVPDATSLDGTAEAIPLPDGWVDAVTCAQAFHWFDAPHAFEELHRVLRADGLLALLWNVRDESVTWVRAMGDIVDELVGGEPRHKLELWLPEARRTPLVRVPRGHRDAPRAGADAGRRHRPPAIHQRRRRGAPPSVVRTSRRAWPSSSARTRSRPGLRRRPAAVHDEDPLAPASA